VYAVMMTTTGRVHGMHATTEVPVRQTTEAAFEAFWAAHRGPLYRSLALTLGDRDLAGEAVDEAMARAFERWAAVSAYANPAGWVYRVGLNWATSVLRRRRRRPVWHGHEGGLEPLVEDPVIAAAVAALPVTQRAVVMLRFSLDWTVDEIAEALGVPSGTVKSRLHRALAALRPICQEDR
jgi:RNA polymerase sigma factor (sigma-70 family)